MVVGNRAADFNFPHSPVYSSEVLVGAAVGTAIAALTTTTKKHARFSFAASTNRGVAFKVISAAWFSFRTQTRPYGGDEEFCRRAYARRGNGRYRFDVKI